MIRFIPIWTLVCYFLTINAVEQQYMDDAIFVQLCHENQAHQLIDFCENNLAIVIVKRTFSLNRKMLNSNHTVSVQNFVALNDVIKHLSEQEFVQWAEKIPIYSNFCIPDDPLWNSQYYLQTIQAENIFAQIDDNCSFNGTCASATIAIIDDAILLTHEDLSNNIYQNPNETIDGIDNDNNGYIDDVNGWDVADQDNDPNPDLSIVAESCFTHGTTVAGCAAAQTNNAIGISSLAYNAKIIPIKSKPNGDCAPTVPFGYLGIEYAMAINADVVNMSWGGPGFSQTYELLLQEAHNQGMVLIAAAGNDAVSDLMYPASYNNVISVGATDVNDEITVFSNYGSAVDIMAPGLDITTTLASANNAYTSSSGTSLSAPIVAAAAALIRCQIPQLSNFDIEDCLLLSTDNIDAQNPNFINSIGNGRLNAFLITNCLQIPPIPQIDWEPEGVVCLGQEIQFLDQSSGDPTTWLWEFESAIPTTSVEQNPYVTYQNEGSFNVTLTVENVNGVATEIWNDIIEVQAPQITLTGTQTIIPGDNAYLTIFFEGDAPFSFIYFDGTTNIEIDNITANPYVLEVSPDATVEYSLVSSTTANCIGAVVGSAIVYVNEGCESLYIGEDITICEYESVTIAPYVEGVQPIIDFNWLNGTGAYLPSENNLNVTYEPSQTEIDQGYAMLILEVEYNDISAVPGLFSYHHGGEDLFFFIDPSTTFTTELQDNFGNDWTAMSYDLDNNSVYGFAGIVGDKGFYTLDLNTNIATYVMPYSEYVFACSYDNDNEILYAISTQSSPGWNTVQEQFLFSINTTTGVKTEIGPLGITYLHNSIFYAQGPGINGMAYHGPTNRLLAMSSDEGNLYEIDVVTGAASLIGNSGLTDVRGLSYDFVNDQLYAISSFGELYIININNGASTFSFDYPFVPITALAFVPNFGEELTICVDTLNVTILEIPEINLGENEMLCQPINFTLSAAVNSNDFNILWSTGETSEEISVNQSNEYWVRVSNDYCSNSDTIIISQTEVPDPAIEIFQICKGQTVTYNGNPDYEYSWQSSSTISCTNCYNPVFSPETNELYIVEILIDNCVYEREIQVFVLPEKEDDIFEIVIEECLLQIVDLNQHSILIDEVIQWNGSSDVGCEFCIDPTVTVSESETYEALVTNSYGCTYTITYNITFDIEIVALEESIEICVGEQIEVNNQILTESGVYEFVLPANDGCDTIYTVELLVDPCIPSVTQEVLFPTGFSPNNDSENEMFRPYVDGILISYNLQVFNRWGDVVFETDNPDFGWDGKIDGVDVPIGVFVYSCQYSFSNEGQLFKQGNVLLIR